MLKMKILVIALVLLLRSSFGLSQNIIDFFLAIPDTSILNLTRSEREVIVAHSTDSTSTHDARGNLRTDRILYALEMVDVKNGFIKLTGAFEGHIDMCYWNMSNGNKLVAIYEQGCGPVCYVAQLDFYLYDGNTFNPLARQEVVPDVYQGFFKGDMKTQMEKMKRQDLLATLLFELPRMGKSIVARWGNEDAREAYEPYARGNSMNLIWVDGKFVRGDIYWK